MASEVKPEAGYLPLTLAPASVARSSDRRWSAPDVGHDGDAVAAGGLDAREAPPLRGHAGIAAGLVGGEHRSARQRNAGSPPSGPTDWNFTWLRMTSSAAPSAHSRSTRYASASTWYARASVASRRPHAREAFRSRKQVWIRDELVSR